MMLKNNVLLLADRLRRWSNHKSFIQQTKYVESMLA